MLQVKFRFQKLNDFLKIRFSRCMLKNVSFGIFNVIVLD